MYASRRYNLPPTPPPSSGVGIEHPIIDSNANGLSRDGMSRSDAPQAVNSNSLDANNHLLDRPQRSRNPKCGKCRNHGKIVNIKGHKRYCPYAKCICSNCILFKERQLVMAKQVALRRAQSNDELLGPATDEVQAYPVLPWRNMWWRGPRRKVLAVIWTKRDFALGPRTSRRPQIQFWIYKISLITFLFLFWRLISIQVFKEVSNTKKSTHLINKRFNKLNPFCFKLKIKLHLN